MTNHEGVQLSVVGPGNNTYHGVLHLHNKVTESTNQTAAQYHFRLVHGNSTNVTTLDDYDHDGAMCYVVVVVLVYGLSILMLIGSQITKRPDKVIEDKEINKYLVDFQVVRDSRRRNENRVMKQDIIAKWNLNKSLCNHDTFMNIHKTAFSVLAVGVVPGVNGASGGQQKQTNLARKAGGQINPLDSPEAGIHCFEKFADWKSRSASLSCVPTCDTLVDVDYETPYRTGNTPYAPTVRDDSAIMLNERTRESRRCSNTPTKNTCSVSSDSKLDWTDDISFSSRSDARLIGAATGNRSSYRYPLPSTSSTDYNSKDWSLNSAPSTGSDTWSREPFTFDPAETMCLLHESRSPSAVSQAERSPSTNHQQRWTKGGRNSIRVTSL